MHLNYIEILSAIDDEIYETPKYYDYEILHKIKIDDVWKLQLNTNYSKTPLDESFEGSQCWWRIDNSISNGTADILAVLPDNQEIVIRFATISPPKINEYIRIYVPQYLIALKEAWSDYRWREKCALVLRTLKTNNINHKDIKLQTSNYETIRVNQAEAFNLLNWDISFLWGPPGTGKTFTLGALLAQLIIQYPSKRVLLLSTTNIAVDQALISVDNSMYSILGDSNFQQSKCIRAGSHYRASLYKGKEHLIPTNNRIMLKELSYHESNRPDKENIKEFSKWKLKGESIRRSINDKTEEMISNAHLVAMTTTRALFTIDKLKKYKFDFVIFDEASQVSVLQALALAPLGNRCLFTGDFKQLSPIVKSNISQTKYWFGHSMFHFRDEDLDSFCMLNEQSRMVKQICDLVSNIFYENKLIMASNIKDKKWLSEHRIYYSDLIKDKTVHIEIVEDNYTWSQKYNGPIRYNSAKFITDLCRDITEVQDQKTILILTPFRAQRLLIKKMLKRYGLKKIDVSTIHSAQGSQRNTIIFDIVDGASDFFADFKLNSSLINVALSRAMARLVIILSNRDLSNKILKKIYNKIGYTSNSLRDLTSYNVSEFVDDINFPHNMLNICVRIKDKIGKVVEIDQNGQYFYFDNGVKKAKYKTEIVKKNFSNEK